MPELSGRVLLKQIQAKHPATPVIVISGLSNEADARALLDMGAFAYFAKPFKLEEIEEAVDRAIARHQELAAKDQSADQAEDLQPTKTLTGRPKLD